MGWHRPPADDLQEPCQRGPAIAQGRPGEFGVQQSAALGLSGVQKVMGSVTRNIIGRMDDKQLLSVCRSIRQFMV